MMKVPPPLKGKRFTDAQWKKIGGRIQKLRAPIDDKTYLFDVSSTHCISWSGKPPLFSQFVGALDREKSVVYRQLLRTERVRERLTKKIEKTSRAFWKVLVLAQGDTAASAIISGKTI